jgi:protein involved in polysaccharide export with SLBB domain
LLFSQTVTGSPYAKPDRFSAIGFARNLISISLALLLLGHGNLSTAQTLPTDLMGAAAAAAGGGSATGSTGSDALGTTGALQSGGQQVDSAGAALANTGVNPQSSLRASTPQGKAKATRADVGTDALNASRSGATGQDSPLEEVEFQRFVRKSTGQSLNLYGYDLFSSASFGAVQAYTVPSGYLMGPGDELVLQVYGLFDVADRITIDRDGRITLPKVGPLTLAGVPFSEAEKVITAHLAKVYKNFSLSVSMGRLRSIEVFVVGQARHPGKQVVSSLSSLINALFETGGPSANGSMRSIELRRAGKTVATVDLYKFLAKGDSTGDAHLLSGDVIYIPPAGARAAVLGTVNAPAIYEVKSGETIAEILALSGGLPVLASPHKVQLDRVNPKEAVARYVQDFALDKDGLAKTLAAGDVLTVFQISPQIANVVTLEGNVLYPMRFSFKPGMKVSDILTDLHQLLPGSYWQQVNQGSLALQLNKGGAQLASSAVDAQGTKQTTPVSYSRPEVNLHYATIQRLDTSRLRTRTLAFNLTKAIEKDPQEDLLLQSGDIVTVYKPGDAGADTLDSVFITGDVVGGSQRFVWRPGFTVKDIIPSAQWLIEYYNYWQRPSGKGWRDDINWDYAQIIRRLPATLSSQAITFNLADAVLREQPSNNVVLQPGDQINIFTTSQVPQPIAKRQRMVTVAGEVAVPGVYQVADGESLGQLIRRAGGFTADAYVYGTEFKRESTRISQQENLNRLIKRYEQQIQADSSKRLQNTVAGDSKDTAAAIQAGIQADQLRLANLRKLQATGRVALSLEPANPKLPQLALEDGDIITVPSVPAFVGAFGAVYNENAILWKPGMVVRDVVRQAGLTNYADESELYVMRADGTVQGGSSGSIFSSSNNSLNVMPGDTLVVPEKADRETGYSAFVRGAKDWTAILAQFGLGAAALRSLGY